MPGSRNVDALGFSSSMDADRGPRLIPGADFATGPDVGEPFPDFELTDSAGRTVRLHADRAGRKAAILFIRSAVW